MFGLTAVCLCLTAVCCIAWWHLVCVPLVVLGGYGVQVTGGLFIVLLVNLLC